MINFVCSIIEVDHLLGLLDCIEFYLVVLERYRQGHIRVSRCCTLELSLDGMVHALAIILQGLLALNHESLSKVLLVQIFDQHGLVLHLLVLASLEVQLLDLFAPLVHLDLHHLAFSHVDLGLTHCLAIARALLILVLKFLVLALIGLLTGFNLVKLQLTLILVPFKCINCIFLALLDPLFSLSTLDGVLLEQFKVLVTRCLVLPFHLCMNPAIGSLS